MLHLDQELTTRLKAHRVRLDVPDENTVVLGEVPTHPEYFNNPTTNLMIKRPQPDLPFIVAVDEDLKYYGSDRELTRAFLGGICQRGWLTLVVALSAQCDREQALEHALGIVGFDGQPPRLPPSVPSTKEQTRNSLISQFAENLTERVADETIEPTTGREDEIADVVSAALCWGQARLPVIAGHSGTGKTNLLHAVARKLKTYRPEMTLQLIDLNRLVMGTVFDGELEKICTALLEELLETEQTILAIEHLELAFCGRVPQLMSRILDRHSPGLIGTVLPGFLSKVQSALSRRMHIVPLEPPNTSETVAIVSTVLERIADHHRISLGSYVAEACVRAAEPLSGYEPAKSITLLDRAASRAAVVGAESLSLDDLYYVAERMPRPAK